MIISIALCTYNGANFVEEQLKSIAKQTRLPDEVIVCDDSSTDRTHELVARFSVDAPFKIYLSRNETQLGVTKNFENALLKCTGDIIFLCDQDDYWRPEKIHLMSEIFENDKNIGLIFSNAVVTDSALNSLLYTIWEVIGLTKAKQTRINRGEALSVLVAGDVVTGATMAFRSSLIKNAIPIPSICFHDAWIAFLAAYTSKVFALDKSLIYYRQHDANLIGGTRENFALKVRKAIDIKHDWFQIEALRSSNLLTRIRSLQGIDFQDKYTLSLENRTRHLLCRQKMFNSSFTKRFRLIALETLSYRYFKYSNGFYSIFIDLFIRGPKIF